MELFCPECASPLGHDATVNGAAWHCRSEHGRTVGMGPLRLLLDRGIASDLWRQSASAEPSRRSCPSCAKTMALVLAPGESGVVEIDLCRRCHIAWIDEGEWEQLPKQPSLPEGEVSVRAAEILTKAEVSSLQSRAPLPPARPWQWAAALFGLPAREDGRRPVFAPVTWTVSLMMAVATIAAYAYGMEEAVARFGLVPAEPGRVGGFTLLTSFFLHGGIIHLLVNLYFLIVVGSAVEQRIGHRRTVVILAASMATAALAHMALDPRPATALVGASGGIAALFAVFALAFPNVPFRIFIFVPYLAIARWIRVSALSLGSVFLALNFVGVWYQLGGWSEVSSLAHLGGGAAGFIFWLAWRTEIKTARRVAAVSTHQLTSV